MNHQPGASYILSHLQKIRENIEMSMNRYYIDVWIR